MRRFPSSIFGSRNDFDEVHRRFEDVIMAEIGNFFSFKPRIMPTRETTMAQHHQATSNFLKSKAEDAVGRAATRRRDIHLLIFNYLKNKGYQETCRALESEAEPQTTLRHFCLSDGFDMESVLQDFEEYHMARFNRFPRICRRSKDITNNRAADSNFWPPWGENQWREAQAAKDLSRQRRSVNFPNIDSRKKSAPINHNNNAGNKKSANPAQKQRQIRQASTGSSSTDTEGSPTSLTARSVQPHNGPAMAKVVNAANKLKERCTTAANSYIPGPDLSDLNPALAKSLLGGNKYNNEWRDLASIISKDIYESNPNVAWDSIVGLGEAKRLVQEAVVYPIKYPQLFQGILSPWRGLLLYGPPGTGKTLLAKAVATECSTTFFNMSASSLISKWRGESEKLVRVLFEMARLNAPSTIFLDELDSLMSHRGSTGSSGEHEGSRRMKTELLTQMDGLASSNDLVFVLAASNLPWELDHAMLRRLEKRVLVNLPEAGARKAMFEQHLPPLLSSATETSLELRTQLDYDKLAQSSEGYSGSDIRLVCKEAAMKRLRQVFATLESQPQQIENDSNNSLQRLTDITVEPVSTEDVLLSLERSKPSAKGLAHKYIEWQQEFESV